MAEVVLSISITEVWVRGQLTEGGWSLQGIYTSRDLADQACVLSNEFVFPATLNQEAPAGDVPRACYPRRQV